ncbi:acyltransferase family protein [Caenimonas sedimenti]|uniref:acyltransferase family protein n=1 Tax=Caenimonas sedimenti TaxID=2596921 RepID=UPI001646E56D|nr:acyltransferase [Caenimonas sedimenti]
MQPTAPAPRARHFDGIDILRGVAALLVLAYHVKEIVPWAGSPREGLGWFIQEGWLGVDIFLGISGFVIAWTAFAGVDAEGTDFRRNFIRHRLARIVPLYLLTCLVVIFLIDARWLLVQPVDKLWAHLVSHALFIHNLFPGTHGSINGPSWSIGLEMQFYAVMCLLAPRLLKMRPAALVLTCVLVAAAWRTGVAIATEDMNGIVRFIYATQLPGVIDQFGLGIGLALLLRTRPGLLAPGWGRFALAAGAAAALFALAATLQMPTGYLNSPAQIVWWRPILSLACTSLLIAALTLPIASAAVLRPLRYLGELSYGIYLWHMPVLLALTRSIPELQAERLLLAVLLGATALAAATWHLLEKPCIQKYRRPQSQAAPGKPQPD